MAKYEKSLKKSICEEIAGGKSPNEIAETYDIKVSNIRNWYKSYLSDPSCFDEPQKTYDSVKDELQGNGIIKQVRSLYLGSTDEMAILAREKYEKEAGKTITEADILANTDEILKGLIIAETEIFNERTTSLAENVIPLYYKNMYSETSEYTHMNELIKSLMRLFNEVREKHVEFEYFIEDINHQIIPVSQHIATSNSQSAKTRAGASLEHHIATLLLLLTP